MRLKRPPSSSAIVTPRAFASASMFRSATFRFPRFDAADVGAVELGLVGETLLRQPDGLSPLTQPFPEPFENVHGFSLGGERS